jgi:hypothetical protein
VKSSLTLSRRACILSSKIARGLVTSESVKTASVGKHRTCRTHRNVMCRCVRCFQNRNRRQKSGQKNKVISSRAKGKWPWTRKLTTITNRQGKIPEHTTDKPTSLGFPLRLQEKGKYSFFLPNETPKCD